MKIPSRSIGAGAVAAVAVVIAFACAAASQAVAEKDKGANEATRSVPDGNALGEELLGMCKYCEQRSDAGPNGTDECSRKYDSLTARAIMACSYPPCPEMRRPMRVPNPQEKLACAACRAMCPFSAGTPGAAVAAEASEGQPRDH